MRERTQNNPRTEQVLLSCDAFQADVSAASAMPCGRLARPRRWKFSNIAIPGRVKIAGSARTERTAASARGRMRGVSVRPLLQHGVIPGSCHTKAQGISSPGTHEAIRCGLAKKSNNGALY